MALFITDFFAARTDRQDALENLDFCHGVLEFSNQPQALLVAAFAQHKEQRDEPENKYTKGAIDGRIRERNTWRREHQLHIDQDGTTGRNQDRGVLTF